MNEEEFGTELGEKETEKETASQGLEECPRCGWRSDGGVKAPAEDVEDYLRAILGGGRFTKKYPLYGGKIAVCFKGLFSDEVDAFNKLMFRMAGYLEESAVRNMSVKLKTLYFLREITLDGEKTEYDIPDGLTEVADIEKEFSSRFGETPELVLRAIAQALFLFEEQQRLVSEAAFDENFWKGVGPH